MSQHKELKLNLSVVLISQLLMLVVNFYTKQAILNNLNAEYMGFQTVCANFSDLLTMAFSAAGTVMLFCLYKPLEDKDEQRLSAIFLYFRKIFRVLTLLAIGAGAILSVVMLACVDMSGNATTGWVLLYYWMYVGGVLIYNRYLNNYFYLMADQKRYMAATVCGAVDVISLVAEIMALSYFRKYELFLLVIMAKNAVECLIIAALRRHYCGQLHAKYGTEAVSKKERKTIRSDIANMVVSKVGSLLLYNTDSILTSAIVSTAVSGFYSCYYFISYGLQFTMLGVFDTIMSKVGRLGVNNTKDEQFKAYVLVSLANVAAVALCVTGFYLSTKDFIILWVGENALLAEWLPLLISVNLYITMCRYTSSSFRQAEGMFKKISWLILFRGVFNLVLSVVLGVKMGLFGIVIATSISDVLTVFWYEPYMVLSHYRRSFLNEIVYQVLGIFVTVSSVWLSQSAISGISGVSWSSFVLKVLIIVAVTVLWLAILAVLVYLIYRSAKQRIDSYIFRDRVSKASCAYRAVSFVMPAYNAQDTIEKAVMSVLAEENRLCELIVVNDGSTDRTGEILQRIAETDSRLHVITVPNGGIGMARNIGMSHVKGKYIAFIDSDDETDWRGMARMADIAVTNSYDVLCGTFTCIDRDECIEGMDVVGDGEVVRTTDRHSIYNRLKVRSAFGYVWNKLYRTEFLRSHNMLFDDVRRVFMEDTLFNLKVFAMNPKYMYLDDHVYKYYVREASTSRQPERDIATKYASLISNYDEFLTENGLRKENADLMIPLIMRTFCWSLIRNIKFEQELSSVMMYKRIECFRNEKAFRDMLSCPEAFETLSAVPSLPQRVLYKSCFVLLKKGYDKLLVRFFIVLYPTFKLYSKMIQVK